MKLIGVLTKKDNTWIIQVPRPVLKVAELNGVKITDKVRVKLRIYRETASVDVDAKVHVYGSQMNNCYLIIPMHVIQTLGLSRGEEIVFEPILEESQ